MTGTERTSADPATLPAGPMTEAQFGTLHERLRQQSPWGPGDRRRALNYITSAEVLTARSRVRLGRVISLSAPVQHQATADNPDPAQHQQRPHQFNRDLVMATSRRSPAGNHMLACQAADNLSLKLLTDDDEPGRDTNKARSSGAFPGDAREPARAFTASCATAARAPSPVSRAGV
jgi:hypothetical protein